MYLSARLILFTMWRSLEEGRLLAFVQVKELGDLRFAAALRYPVLVSHHSAKESIPPPGVVGSEVHSESGYLPLARRRLGLFCEPGSPFGGICHKWLELLGESFAMRYLEKHSCSQVGGSISPGSKKINAG
jgi:hypothetical protein